VCVGFNALRSWSPEVFFLPRYSVILGELPVFTLIGPYRHFLKGQ